jgi:mannosyltransferase OCH1-like enzyme
MIPQTIHQSWKTREVPEKWRKLQETWTLLHPNYAYYYWTDEDNRAFVAHHYSELLKLYDGYALDIHRAELARYLVMRHFGGVYVDMDFEALRPLDDLIAPFELVFGLEPDSHSARAPVRERGFDRIVCNAFIASAPNHPFWGHLVSYLWEAKDEANVLDATGPFLLTRACNAYGDAGGIYYAPASLLYPLDNEESRKLNADDMRAKIKDAYAVHHWSGSWLRESLFQRARATIARARPTNPLE